MKRSILFVAIILLSGSTATRVTARNIRTWSYEDLFRLSEFVVVAQPRQRTRDTTERTALTDIAPPTPVIGVTTDFETVLVLKGHMSKRFTLHHYRLVPYRGKGLVVNGPSLVTFDPKKRFGSFLLFLIRESDGRFAPAGGQTDVDEISVQELSSAVVE